MRVSVVLKKLSGICLEVLKGLKGIYVENEILFMVFFGIKICSSSCFIFLKLTMMMMVFL